MRRTVLIDRGRVDELDAKLFATMRAQLRARPVYVVSHPDSGALLAAVWSERTARAWRRARPDAVIALVSLGERDDGVVAHGTTLPPRTIVAALARAADATANVTAARQWVGSWANGEARVWLDEDDEEIVWWGAFHPKGDHEYETRQSIADHRVSGPRPPEGAPPEILDALAAAVARFVPPERSSSEALVLAVRAADAARVASLLAAGADPSAHDRRGEVALAIALERRLPAIALQLLRAGADPDRVEGGADSCLVSALGCQGWELASELLDRGARRHHELSLTTAIAHGAPIALLDRLLRAGAPPVPARSEWAHVAIRARALDPAFAAWLREHVGELPGLPPPTRTNVAPTPIARPRPDTRLHDAVARGDVDEVRALLARGLAPNGHDWNRRAPLLRTIDAPAERQAELVAALVAGGARVADRDAFGATALVKAVRRGAHAVVRALCAAGADVEARDDGATALSWAASNGDPEMVELLLRAGARPDARDGRGLTPLDHAVRARSEPCAELLRGRSPAPPRDR